MGSLRLNRANSKLIASLILAIIFVILGYFGNGNDGSPSEVIRQNQPGLYQVKHFTDGDTISVIMNNHEEKIRFIGIDTPETHKPNTPVQCYGPQAAARTRQIIGKNPIRLVADPLTTNRDRYDRLLRYVYLASGTNVNQQLIAEGYAFYYPYFPFSKSEEFGRTQAEAQQKKLGVWGSCNPSRTDGGGYISEYPTKPR